MIAVAKFLALLVMIPGFAGLGIGIPVLMEAGALAAVPRFGGPVGTVYLGLAFVLAGAALYLLAVIADQLTALRAALVPEPDDWYLPNLPKAERAGQAIGPPRQRR